MIIANFAATRADIRAGTGRISRLASRVGLGTCVRAAAVVLLALATFVNVGAARAAPIVIGPPISSTSRGPAGARCRP